MNVEYRYREHDQSLIGQDENNNDSERIVERRSTEFEYNISKLDN